MAHYEIPAGDDRVIVHRFTDDGAAFNLTGSSVYWRLFNSPQDADASAVLTRTWLAGTEDGLSLTDPITSSSVAASAGILYNHLTDANTLALTAGKTYFYELKVVDTNTFVTTVDTGTLIITGVASTSPPKSGTTLQQLRRLVADMLDDYENLTATANGTTTTIVDTYHVNDAAEHFKGRDVVCLSGTNAGLRRRVTGSNPTTGTLTLNSALTASTAAGDMFDVFNRHGRGFRAEQYDRAINRAIVEAFPASMIHIVDTVSVAFDAETPEITVPASIVDVIALEAQDSDGDWHVVPKANRRGGDGWWADKGSGQLRLHGYSAWRSDNLTLRIHGRGRQDELSSDSDTCALNVEYVTTAAAYRLALSAVENEQMALRVNDLRGQFTAARSRARTFPDPHQTRVRSI